MKRIAFESKPLDTMFWYDAGIMAGTVTEYEEAIEYFNHSI